MNDFIDNSDKNEYFFLNFEDENLNDKELKKGLDMPNIPDTHFDSEKTKETNNTKSKNDNHYNNNNKNLNQNNEITLLIPNKVYPCPEFTTKKREREDSPLTTKNLDKNKNDPKSKDDIIKKIENQITKEISVDYKIYNYNQSIKENTKNESQIKAVIESHGLLLEICSRFEIKNNPRTDNKYEENWMGFLGLIKNSLNDIIKEYNINQHKNIAFLNNTNFKKQFYEKKKEFINLTLYKFLTYNPPENQKYQTHYYNGSCNLKIIKEMKNITIGQTDQIKLFNAIIQLDLKTIHSIFMQEEKKVYINGTLFDLSSFKRFNDYKNELEEKLAEKNFVEEEINVFSHYFDKKFSNLIKKFEELKEKDEKKKNAKMRK